MSKSIAPIFPSWGGLNILDLRLQYFVSTSYKIRDLQKSDKAIFMLGQALYYPYIDIHDVNWLRSAVLFYDGLQTIAPSSVGEPYHNIDTRILSSEKFLTPLRCDLHPDLLDKLGKRVIKLMDLANYASDRTTIDSNDPNRETMQLAERVGSRIWDQFHRARLHPEKLSPELRDLAMRGGLARMHPMKFSPGVRGLIEKFRFREKNDRKNFEIRSILLIISRKFVIVMANGC